jgi:hypothetical protein
MESNIPTINLDDYIDPEVLDNAEGAVNITAY